MTDAPDSVGVADVLITDELASRPSRQPDYESESQALGLLAQEMTTNPRGVLQKCADLVMELCHADSAGISILEPGGTSRVLRWHAAAGAFAPNLHGTMPAEASPCGTVIERNCVLLFHEAERFFPALRGIEPRIYENLLAPWHAKGEAVGTLWAIKHTPEGRFDAEDARLMASLANFAAVAYQLNRQLSALRESEEKYRSLYTEMGQGYIEVELIRGSGGDAIDYRYLALNPAYERLTGIPVDKAVGRPSLEVIPDLSPFWAETFQRIVDNQTAEEFEYEEKALDRWYGIYAYPSAGDRLTVLALDITQRKKSEAALRESEERYRTLFESMDEGYLLSEVVLDEAGKPVDIHFLDANPAAVRLAGRDFTGQRMREIDPNYEKYWYEVYGRVALTGEPIRAEHYAEPHGRWFDFHLSKVGSAESRLVASVFQDITESKESEEALRESEKRLAAELESAKALQKLSGLLITDSESRRLFEQIVDTAIAVMKADFGSIQLMHSEHRELELIASRNFSPEAETYWQRVSVETASACGSALSHGERVIIENVATDERTRSSDNMGYWKSSGIVAVQSTPLTARDGTIIGMISTHWREPHHPEERQLRLFDVLARQAADYIERARAEEALRESEERYRTLFESIDEGFCLVEYVDDPSRSLDFRFVEVNRAFERQSGLTNVVGKLNSEVAPDVADYWKESYAEVARTGVAQRLENHHEPTDRWFDVFIARVGGEGSRQICLVFKDTTENKRAEEVLRESEERQALLLKLSDRVRPLADPADIQGETTRLLREHLDAGWCYYVDWNVGQKTGSVLRDSVRDGLPSLVGVHDVSDAPDFLALLSGGSVLKVSDYASFEQLSARIRENFTGLGFRSMMVAPLVKNGRLIASLLVGDNDVRDWSANDESLLVEVAERTWAAVERARAEAALRREEERQAFLLKLSDAVRLLADPAEVQATTTRLLGEHLGADRVMYAEVEGEPGEEAGTIRGQFVRPAPDGKAPVPFPEHFTFGQFGQHTMAARYRGEPLIVSDVQNDPAYNAEERAAWQAFGVRAAIVAALAKGGRLVAEFGVHSTQPRQWIPAEISLVEDVAERTWAAAERARAQSSLRESEERYRNLFESMDEAYAVVDVLKDDEGKWYDFRFVEVNPAFIHHTNMPPPVGKTATELLGTPNPRWTELYGEALDTGKALRVEESEATLGLTFDLNIFTLDASLNRVAVLFSNITDRKLAEEELRQEKRRQEMLLAELQHRVRNTLAVIRSIVRRTAESSQSIDEFETNLDGRLASFARTQAYVTRDPGAGIDLELILRDELLAHANDGSQHVRIEGPEIRLSDKQAETLGLAIHELTNNAIKYGALSCDGNHIDVRWSIEEGEPPMLHFHWREKLKDRALKAPKRPGFGTELLEKVLEYELDAEPTLEYRPDGLDYRVTLPLQPFSKSLT